jgi:hypothetical protein
MGKIQALLLESSRHVSLMGGKVGIRKSAIFYFMDDILFSLKCLPNINSGVAKTTRRKNLNFFFICTGCPELRSD